MTSYLIKVRNLLLIFKSWQIIQDPKVYNAKVDSLACLDLVPNVELSIIILVKYLSS